MNYYMEKSGCLIFCLFVFLACPLPNGHPQRFPVRPWLYGTAHAFAFLPASASRPLSFHSRRVVSSRALQFSLQIRRYDAHFSDSSEA